MNLILRLIAGSILASTFTAFSVSNVTKLTDDNYLASKNISPNPVTKADEKTKPTKAGANVPDQITVTTSGCTHVPAAGETAIILTGPRGSSILFSAGVTCKVTSYE